MAAGKEIKRLREKQENKVSVAKAAALIGIDPERLRKWEQRNTDPADLEDAHKIEQYFGVAINDLKTLDNFQFIKRPAGKEIDQNRKDTKIAALESELIKMKLDKLETNLNEVLSNQKVMMALMTTAMNNAIEYYSENNPAKAVELKGKTRSRIHAATKKGA